MKEKDPVTNVTRSFFIGLFRAFIAPGVLASAFFIVAFLADGIAEPVRCVNFFTGIAGTKSYFVATMWTVNNLVHVESVAFDVPVIWYIVWFINLFIIIPAVKRCHFCLLSFHHTSRNCFCHSQSIHGEHNQDGRYHKRCNLDISQSECQ